MEEETKEIFRKTEKLEELGLGIPQITCFYAEIQVQGNPVDNFSYGL